jgi:PRTRC genetic system protein A
MDEQNEVMVQIYWDSVEKRYLIYCPYQRVNKVHIEAEFNVELERSSRFIQVMQLHSHNIMKAFFSCTDNANELAYLLYGVVGRLDQEIPEIQIRVGYNGSYLSLPLLYVFESPDLTNIRPFPKEWLEKVQVMK